MSLKSTGTSLGQVVPIAGAFLALVAAPACAPKAARRQTDVMEKTGSVSVSATVLRARVDDLAERLAGRLEATSDRIRREARDPAVRRRALTAKIETIPAIYSAAYRVDPLEAALDVWALAFQLAQFVEGEGREAFGPQQPLVRDLARDVLADADAVMQGITISPEAFARARGRVEQWAKTHPIERNFMSRPSITASMADVSADRDAFVAVGAVSDTLENVSERLNTYAAQLPKQARWQAELLVADMTAEPVVADALGDVHALGTTARHANELFNDMPGFLGAAGGPVRELMDVERRAVLEGVNAQRLQTLEVFTAERLAVLAAAREERIAALETLQKERIEILKEIDAIKSRAVEASVSGLREIVDYALWRVAVLLLFLMFAATGLGVVAYRLTLGRRRDAERA
jgi:hypothetical protein